MSRLIEKCPSDPTLAAAYVTGASIALDAVAPYVAVINLDAIKMLIDASSPAQMILSPTTNSGYGIGEAGIFCTEETPMRPVSLYGTLKVDLEQLLLASGRAVSGASTERGPFVDGHS